MVMLCSLQWVVSYVILSDGAKGLKNKTLKFCHYRIVEEILLF